jgi:hypothetical protein
MSETAHGLARRLPGEFAVPLPLVPLEAGVAEPPTEPLTDCLGDGLGVFSTDMLLSCPMMM